MFLTFSVKTEGFLKKFYQVWYFEPNYQMRRTRERKRKNEKSPDTNDLLNIIINLSKYEKKMFDHLIKDYDIYSKNETSKMKISRT